MEEKKSYFAIIPANVRYDKSLTPNAKLLYGEITALCNDKGFCWAANKYFADLYEVSNTSVSKWISSLIDAGYIESRILYKEGTKEIDKRYITIVLGPIKEKLNTPLKELLKPPIEEKLKGNNTVLLNNTVVNSTLNNNKLYDDFLFILNLTLNKDYRGCTKSRQKFPARIKEGYKLEDFKNAVSNASLDIYHIETGFKYLTPEFFTRSDKLDKFRQAIIVPISPQQKTNYDHFNDVSQQITDRINSIPDECYEQFKQQYIPGL